MSAVVPIAYATPDGVECRLRWTLGSRKRMKSRFGQFEIQQIVKEHGDEVIPEIAYLMMFDENGAPPKITVEQLTEAIQPDEVLPLYSAIFSACMQGKESPNEILERWNKLPGMVEQLQEALSKLTNTGSNSGDSVDSALDSATETSGTDSLNVKSTLSEEPTEIKSEAALS